MPQGQSAVRTFTISNTSNITDAYRITAANVSAGKIASLVFITPGGPLPIAVGSSISPMVPAGGTIAVRVTVVTNGLAIGQSLSK